MTRPESGRPLDILEGVPLAPLCTLGVGGAARHYVVAHDDAHAAAAVAWARERALPLLLLGGGSNVVVADEGHPGLVLHLDLRGVSGVEDGGTVLVTAAAGEEWDPLVARCVAQGWAGLECLSGIPGRVGATPIQNVGAYGQDVSETVERVDGLELATGASVSLPGAECGFAYRDSRFKRADAGRFLVTSVSFRLRPGGAPAVRYAELERALRESGTSAPALAEVRDTVIALRRRKSMVLEPGDENRHSVGSFFMNPTVSPDDAERIRARVRAGDVDGMPAFPAGDGRVKLSAAWLIERAGLTRGYGKGAVGLSTRHTLAIVNRGGATARQVVEFARMVRDRVRDRFHVALRPEPVFVNLDFDGGPPSD
ncbi:MAG TPA: UDP-N-acetylmuramate dehydrogenase [Vicinamibacteria bacterium]|nr:UDP-N-acetylmuramate dehydrogenase [Vicinamibacteria bacterium]